MVASKPSSDLAGRRQRLQLETLYDLVVALHSHESEQGLLDDLLQRVCTVVDPAAAAAVTRDPFGVARAAATVGFGGRPPSAETLLAGPLWHDLLAQDETVARSGGKLAEREFRSLVAAPLKSRDSLLGFVAVLDKEARGAGEAGFTDGDRRFLRSVAALAGVALDGLRQVERLVVSRERLAEENKLLKERLDDLAEVGGQRIVAYAPVMRRILEVIDRVAPRSVSVLLHGESGTGKELMAALLHQRSERSGPLVAVNCAALPESLLESELFGIEGGVATGVRARLGRFELADGGTLFLDEVADLDVASQVKLLRALQEREIVRVGGHQAIPVDTRVVAATHQPLEQLVAEGRFREDLYYRLKGISVELPPLRERRRDIPHLVRYFAERFCEREAVELPQFDRGALNLLLAHDYPGNVRELQNIVEGAASLADGVVDASLIQSLIGGAAAGSQGPEPLDLETVKRRHVRRVIGLTGGNKSAAAKLLGVHRRTLSRGRY